MSASIDGRRAPPRIRWRAVLAGVALATVVAIAATALLPPIPGALASLFGLALGGFLAGFLASEARAYHGALTGAGLIVLETLGVIPTRSYAADPVADVVAIIVVDALVLAVATIAAWSSSLVSSSDTGRGR